MMMVLQFEYISKNSLSFAVCRFAETYGIVSCCMFGRTSAFLQSDLVRTGHGRPGGGLGNRCRQHRHVRIHAYTCYFTYHFSGPAVGRPTQPPTLRGTGNEYRPKCGDTLQMRSNDRMAHSTFG